MFRLRKCFSRQLSASTLLDPRKSINIWGYCALNNLRQIKTELKEELNQHGILGRVYLSQEGINAQLSVSMSEIAVFIAKFNAKFPVLSTTNLFVGDTCESFQDLRIHVRTQLVRDKDDSGDDAVTMGDLASYPTIEMTPDKWHEAVTTKDYDILIDCRNYYESEIGRFDGATLLTSSTFRDSFAELKKLLPSESDDGAGMKRILLYCTGGIRCEKIGCWLQKTFNQDNQRREIFKLRGGINNYVQYWRENQSQIQSCFLGKLFQFDDRALSNDSCRVTSHMFGECSTCGVPCDTHTNCTSDYCSAILLQCVACKVKYRNTCGCHHCLTITEMTSKSDKARYAMDNNLMYSQRLQGRSSSLLRDRSFMMSQRQFSSVPLWRPDSNFSGCSVEDTMKYCQNNSTHSPLAFSANKSPEFTSLVELTCKLLESVVEKTLLIEPNEAHMMSGPWQAGLLMTLSDLVHANRILEIGSFTGYTAISLALVAINNSMNSKGQLVRQPSVETLEFDSNRASIAQQFMYRFNSEYMRLFNCDRSVLKIDVCNAHVWLRQYKGEPFKFIFVDADKSGYEDYFDTIFEPKSTILDQSGIVAFDNVLWKGEVVAEANDATFSLSKNGLAMKQFMNHVKQHTNIVKTLLPIRDGLLLVRNSKTL